MLYLKIRQWLNLNLGPLMLEVTVPTTESQPLPSFIGFYGNKVLPNAEFNHHLLYYKCRAVLSNTKV